MRRLCAFPASVRGADQGPPGHRWWRRQREVLRERQPLLFLRIAEIRPAPRLARG